MNFRGRRAWMPGLALLFCGLLLALVCDQRPERQTITAGLKTTFLPSFSLRDTPVPAAVETVMQRVRREHPELRGVPVIYRFSGLHPGRTPQATMDLTNIPADLALRYVASQTGLGYAVRNNAIYFYPLSSTDDGEQTPPLTGPERLVADLRSFFGRVREP